MSAPDPRRPLLLRTRGRVGLEGRALSTWSCALGGWSSGHVLCTPTQGLPGPSGEKGETGDVGPMVSVTP